MAIAEAERLVSRLGEAAVPVDSLVVNRIFENEAGCPCDRCRRDAERHAQRLQEIDDRFDLPVRQVPQLPDEAQGLDALSTLGPSLSES
jgi:arsenite-transporting ATPase